MKQPVHIGNDTYINGDIIISKEEYKLGNQEPQFYYNYDKPVTERDLEQDINYVKVQDEMVKRDIWEQMGE